MPTQENFQVAIIGLGRVGITTAYATLLKGLATKLILISRDAKKAEGERRDLVHGSPFYSGTEIIATDNYADLRGTDLTIFTAGCSQKPGQTRLDLNQDNYKVVDQLIPKIVKHAPNTLILMVSNPLDVMTYRAAKLASLPKGRVFGSGTMLDTARYRTHLAKLLHINATSIHAYILGEHGDSSFTPTNTATIGGKPLLSFPEFSPDQLAWALEQTRKDAYKIISAKGATYYGIATALTHLIDVIKHNKKKVVPISSPLHGEYGLDNIALSLPCILGRKGVIKTIELPLTPDEKEQLQNSATIIRNHIKAI